MCLLIVSPTCMHVDIGDIEGVMPGLLEVGICEYASLNCLFALLGIVHVLFAIVMFWVWVYA